MINYKVQHGVRILSNDEKMLMFGLVDKEMRENINQLKKLVGIKSPVQRKKKQEQVSMTSTQKLKVTTGERCVSQGTNNLLSPGIISIKSKRLSSSKLG